MAPGSLTVFQTRRISSPGRLPGFQRIPNEGDHSTFISRRTTPSNDPSPGAVILTNAVSMTLPSSRQVVRPRQRGLCNFTNLDNKAEVDLSVITWTLLNLSLGFDPEGRGLLPTGRDIGGN
jgi:hypothetical protein